MNILRSPRPTVSPVTRIVRRKLHLQLFPIYTVRAIAVDYQWHHMRQFSPLWCVHSMPTNNWSTWNAMRSCVKRQRMQLLLRPHCINRCWPIWAAAAGPIKATNKRNHAIRMVSVVWASQVVRHRIVDMAVAVHRLHRQRIAVSHRRFHCHRHQFHRHVWHAIQAKQNIRPIIRWAAIRTMWYGMHYWRHRRRAINGKSEVISRDGRRRCCRIKTNTSIGVCIWFYIIGSFLVRMGWRWLICVFRFRNCSIIRFV